MIARSFRPVVWVFMIGTAVLGCYLLNLRVAAERAELAKLDRQIIAAQRSIRALQTEVGTRSRIPQLQEWNNEVLALSAPVTGQYVQSNVSLARFDMRQPPQLADQAEVRLAAAETGVAPAPGETLAVTPAPRRAVAAPPPAAARPEVRRASLTVGAATPAPAKSRETAAAPRREAERVVRAAARDDIRPGPREARTRTAAREDRTRAAARDGRRTAPVRTAARDEQRPGPARTTARDERRTTPARTSGRAAASPARGASGRMLASERPARALRRDERPQPRRSTRD